MLDLRPLSIALEPWEPRALKVLRLGRSRVAALLDDVPLAVEAFGRRTLRLRLGELSSAGFDLVQRKPNGILSVEITEGGLSVQASGINLTLTVSPFGLRISHGGKTLLRNATDGHIRGGYRLPFALRGGGAWGLAFALDSDEGLFGLGEKFDALNRRGKLYTSWNEDALGVNTEKSYKNVPFIWSTKGWGIYLHSCARSHHGVGFPQWSHRSYVLVVEEEALDLFLFVGAPQEILESYARITGTSPEVPRWSYGVWWSRCYYRNADEVMQTARELRARKIPGDVVVLDGRAWLDTQTRCALEWDSSRYPDPGKFVAEIKKLGFRVCLWEYPYISVHNPIFKELASKGYFLRNKEGDPYIFEWDPKPFGELLTPLPPSGILDFTQEEVVRWWQGLHRNLFGLGVDVMKTDFGEQVPEDAWGAHGHSGKHLHNAYALLYNKAVYECTPARMVFARSGFAGSQRYPVHWGGDPQADWEGLAASIRGGLSWGLSGGAYYAHDVGGFYGMPDVELYIRWMQAAVFFSHIRFHGTSPREPYHFGDVAESLARSWLRLRMALIPYLQSLAKEASATGLPLARALPLVTPQDPCSWSFDTQFLLGSSLLIAPVTRPGGEVRVYLPRGRWYDLWEGTVYEGPDLVSLTCPLERIPIFLREGGVLPWGTPADRAEDVRLEGYVVAGEGRPLRENSKVLRVPEDFTLSRAFLNTSGV